MTMCNGTLFTIEKIPASGGPRMPDCKISRRATWAPRGRGEVGGEEKLRRACNLN